MTTQPGGECVQHDDRSESRCWCRCRQWLASLAIYLGLVTTGYGAGGDIIWQTGDSRTGKQESKAMAVDSLGNVIVTGYQNINGGADDDYLTVKFKADGSGVAWRATYDGSGGADQATAVAVDASNDIFVTGFTWNGLNFDIHTRKYSGASGSLLWQHTYSGAAGGNDHATSIAIDTLGNVYIGGYSQGEEGDDDFLVLKYGPNGGAPQWSATYSGPAGGNDQLMSITAGSDGIAVTGQSWNGTSFDLMTVKYDYSGSQLWTKNHATGDAMGKKVRMDAAGNVFVAGFATNGTTREIYSAKYRGTDGTLLWSNNYGGGYENDANGLTVDAAGDVYLTGYTWTLEGNENYYTARYGGATGNIVWQQTFDSGSGNTDVAVPLVLDEAGDLYVTGYTVSAAIYRFQTIRYKRDNGNLLWQRTFTGPANDDSRPVGIGLSPEGEILVAGWTDNGANDLDYYVVTYDNGALNQPSTLAATVLSSSSIHLEWTDNSSNEDGFKIERKLGELGGYTQIATVGADVSSYTDSGLESNNYYYYRVRAFSAVNGDSHYSNEAHALTVYLNQLTPAWTYIYANPDNLDDYANGIAVGPDNHPVVTGFSQRTVGGFDYFTLKLNRSDKSVLWSDLYDDPDSEMDKATCVAVNSANSAVVSGFASLFFPPAQKNINSIYTISYPPTGPQASWAAQYNGPGGVDDRAVAIATATATDSSNNSIVVGHGKNTANNDDIYVIKYQQNGTLAWSAAPFDGNGGNDYPNAVAVAADGSVYVAGYSETAGGSGSYKLFVAKYNGGTGALIWADVYSPQTGGNNRANSAAVDAAGDLYVTGYATNGAGDRDLFTIKYSGAGTTPQRLWERPVDGAAHGDDEGIGIKVDPINGDIVVAGTTLIASGDHDITLLRYSTAGSMLWQRTVQRHDNDDHAVVLAMDSSGYLYIAGTTSIGLTSDLIALLYDHEGISLGITMFNGTANSYEEASGITVNYLGEAFISGYTTNAAGDADYVVVKQINPYILVPAPLFAASQADYSRISLSWGDNSPGTSFLIERTIGPITEGSVWTAINTASPGTTSYQDTGLNGNTLYCYRISAFSGSLFSRKITTCVTTTLPPPAMNPLAIVSPTAIDISWSNVAGNTGYKLERQAGTDAWIQLGGLLAADTTIYHDSGLTSGTLYGYRVSSVSSAGTSLPGTVVVAPVLNAPAGITSAKIDLSWPAVSGATGYRVERSPDNSAWALIASPLAAATSYSDTIVASGVLYYYRLKAVTAAGESAPSLVQSASSKLKTPAITSATGTTSTEIAIVWSDLNNNESGYTVEYAACIYDNPANCNSSLNSDGVWGGWNQAAYGADSTSATLGSLTPGRTYRIRVTANLPGADSDASTKAAATTNLIAPTNLTAIAATGTTATLSWSDILGETNYRVLKDGVILTGGGLPLARNATSYTAVGLLQNVQYCFNVQPYNTYSADTSNQACVTLYGPPTLTGITSIGQTQLTLNWGDVPGATGYEVWKSAATSQYNPPTSPSTGSWNAYTNLTPTLLEAGTTAFTVNSGLMAGYTYKFQIRYKLADGSFSPYSNELMETTIPPTPSQSSSVISVSQINLNWSDGYGETGYSLQVKPRAGSNCTTEDWSGITPVEVAQNTTSYQATGLTEGTVYCLRLQSVNGNGSSPWTTPLTSITLLPAPLLNPLTDITQSQISLSWSNVSGNYGYRIERSTNNVNWSQIALPATDVVTYTSTNLLPSQIYYYRVATKNSAGAYSSPASNVQSATTLAVTSPILSPLSGITTSQIILAWNDVAGNYGYKVERSTDNVNWSQIATPVQGSTGYTSTGLSAGTLYYYRVSTKNSSGNYSAPSNLQSATTTPVAPVVSAAVISEARIDLTWQVVPGATNYRILRSIGQSGPFDQVADPAIPYLTLYCGTSTTPSIACPTLVAAFTSHADAGLAENTQYCYQVRAWNATGGDSVASTTVCGKTSAVNGPNLTAVTALNAMKIRLDWTYNPDACSPTPCETPDGFQILRQSWTGEWLPIETVANVTTYLDTTCIEPQKSYAYKIRAYKGGDLSPFSNSMGTMTPAFDSESNTCP